MPDPIVGQAKSGRWWVQCPRPSCDYYGVAADKPGAEALGRAHEKQHQPRGNQP